MVCKVGREDSQWKTASQMGRGFVAVSRSIRRMWERSWDLLSMGSGIATCLVAEFSDV
jgi:hypothetical protein